MSKTSAEPDRAGRSRRRLRRRRVPLPLHGRPALRSRRRLLLRSDGAALQRRPREQLRQPREPRAEHGGELRRRRRARADRADGPLVDAAGADVRRRCRTAMARLDFASAFGAVWDLIRAAELVHRGAAAVGVAQGRRLRRGRRGARRLPRGAAHRRAARVAGDPERGRRAVAPHRDARPSRAPAAARRGALGPARARARGWRRARRCSREETSE